MRLLSLTAFAAAATIASTAVIADANSDYLTANAKKPGVQSAMGGLQYKVLKSSTGKKPSSSSCERPA